MKINKMTSTGLLFFTLFFAAGCTPSADISLKLNEGEITYDRPDGTGLLKIDGVLEVNKPAYFHTTVFKVEPTQTDLKASDGEPLLKFWTFSLNDPAYSLIYGQQEEATDTVSTLTDGATEDRCIGFEKGVYEIQVAAIAHAEAKELLEEIAVTPLKMEGTAKNDGEKCEGVARFSGESTGVSAKMQ